MVATDRPIPRDRSRDARKTPLRRKDGRARNQLAAAVQAGKTVSSAVRAAAETGPSWYHAEFASPGAQHNGRERSAARYALRDAIGQSGLSTLPRLVACGNPLGHSDVPLHKSPGEGVYASGVENCGSPWACPKCGATIRNHRAGEIVAAVAVNAERGGGQLLATRTLPHGSKDPLVKTLGVLKDAMRALTSGKAYKEEKERFGIIGTISSYEITYGENGWHPHIHQLVLTSRVISRDEVRDLQGRQHARWNRALVRLGWSPSLDGVGTRIDLVRKSADAAARYVAKLQEGERWETNAANEITRGDLKSGRKSSRVPFEIVADALSDGLVEDWDLWQEYEQATKGRSSIRWSRGLRALLLPDEPEELTDEEAANVEPGGDVIAVVDHVLYRQVRRRPYGLVHLFGAAEAGGVAGVRRFVKAIGLDPGRVSGPEKLMTVERCAA